MEQNKIKLLLVEDERMLAEILADTLSARGMEVTLAYDGEQGLAAARVQKPDILVCDIMMPRMDGYTLVEQLRREGYSGPVMFLTARSATEDVVRGFEVGATDYLRKPFALEELIVRIRSMVKRIAVEQQEEQNRSYGIGLYTFTPSLHRLSIGDRHEILSTRETEVLNSLVRKMGETVDSSTLLRELWGDDTFFNLRSLNVFISRLRHHLSADPNIEIINIRGKGYKLRVED